MSEDVEATPQGPKLSSGLRAKCGACGVDISRCCYVTVLQTPQGPLTLTLFPMVCPECNTPVLQTSAVLRPPFPPS